MRIHRTWLISQEEGRVGHRTFIPLACTACQNAVRPAERSAQDHRGNRGERFPLRRDVNLGVGEPQGAAIAFHEVAALALSKFHLDFGVVDGVTDGVAVEAVILAGGQETLLHLLSEGDSRGGLYEEVHFDLGVDDVGVILDLGDLQVVVPHVFHCHVINVADNLQCDPMFGEKKVAFGLRHTRNKQKM